MKRRYYLFIAVLFLLTLTCLSFTQSQKERLHQKISIKPGLGFEYFSRTISWDEDQSSSKLKSSFFTFSTEIEFQEGFSVTGFFGYSFSNYDSMTFKKLPFSIELEVGEIGGYLFGGEINKSIFYIKDFEIGGFGQFVYYLGVTEEWEIPGLAVKGTVEGKPSWMRASIGPVVKYTGFDYFYPYIYINFNKLWGKFKLEQTVQDLKGSEEKEISGKSLFSTSLGAIYELTDAFSIKAEASFMPHKNGVDLGFMIKTMYSF